MFDLDEPDVGVGPGCCNNRGGRVRIVRIATDKDPILPRAPSPLARAILKHIANDLCLPPSGHKNGQPVMVNWVGKLVHHARQRVPAKGQPPIDNAGDPDNIDAQIIDSADQNPNGAEQK